MKRMTKIKRMTKDLKKAQSASRSSAKRFKNDFQKFANLLLHPEIGGVAKQPEHVVILGMGPSLDQYSGLVKRLGSRKKLCDETWAINALGDLFQCDRIFHMDDVKSQEIRAAAQPQSNIANMLEWLKVQKGPIYTSVVRQGYAGLVEYPLQDVINSIGSTYLNNTCAAAVAFAIHIGVRKISLFGCDFTYPNAHHAERGRACVEFLLGIAHARGIRIGTTHFTTLLDSCESQRTRIYGYNCSDLEISGSDGQFKVEIKDRADMPTAESLEELYDHNAHPNTLVRNGP